MENDVVDNASAGKLDNDGQALNSTILEYYKKFGRKRDLEQYFSLNTAQGDIKDVTSLFWRKMKSQESSDSGERSRDSSLEVCRISIKCSAPNIEEGSSQDDDPKNDNSNSGSPPIVIEEVVTPAETSKHSDNESVKSDDNNSQKSMDVVLDTSLNKAFSPTSSITSQRKLEWDSLADVGYYNESDKKTSASSLSTLERLALKQQYSNNDNKQENVMGPPTAHSTPVDENEFKSKNKKGSKTTKIYRKDVDFLEVNVPHTSESNPPQSINVNLTKHISLNVDKCGVSVENVKKDVSILPEKKSAKTEVVQLTVDKEIQTSLVKKDKSISSDIPKNAQLYGQGVPVLINLNAFKKRTRRRKFVAVRRQRIKNKLDANKENLPVLEKSGEQVSEAESFEYMPGHIYNQNQINKEQTVKRPTQTVETNQTTGNKSSLESSGPLTTDSSRGSRHSFTKDLEKSIKLLKTTLSKRYNDSEIKKKLIKEVVQRLIQSNYRDDETSTEFLSGLSFNSKKLGLREGNTTTSTSDANNTVEKDKKLQPKKSILRSEKFNANIISSTSQSAPNLPAVSHSEKPVSSLKKSSLASNTESDTSSREKVSSDAAFAKTSSEELYQKYLDALRREQAYKKHLRDKEMFLRQKLVGSETLFNVPATKHIDPISQLRLKELMNDLTRNNYDDGSGDASKLEGSLRSMSVRPPITNQRNHSVFTLSSGNSDQNRRSNLKKCEMKDAQAGHSKEDSHFCCCFHHCGVKVSDSSAQVNLCGDETCSKKAKDSSGQCGHIVPDEKTGEVKYLCLCDTNVAEIKNAPESVLIYKCSRLANKGVQSPGSSGSSSRHKTSARIRNCDHSECRSSNRSSQTYLKSDKPKETIRIHEAVRVIQTDISINPRISDPSLTDIKIINSNDCAKLVLEQYRDVSKTTVTTETKLTEYTDAQVGGSTEMSDSVSSTGYGENKFYKDDSQMAIYTEEAQVHSGVEMRRESVYGEGDYGDNLTIPIKGTNMTLKVTLDSKIPADVMVNDYPKTCDNATYVDNAACVTERYSKGIQSQNEAIFVRCDDKPLNTIFTRERSPPNSRRSPNRKPPLLRSNTNIGISEGSHNIQKDLTYDYNTDILQRNTYPKSPKETRTRSESPYKCSEPENIPHSYKTPETKNSLCPKSTRCICNKNDSYQNLDECPCPNNAKCRGTCADCRKVKKSTRSTSPCPCPDQGDCDNTAFTKLVSRSTSPCPCPENSPCGCPESAMCQGTCRNDLACRQKNTKITRCTSPSARSNISVGSRKQERPISPRKGVKKIKAPCYLEASSSSRRNCFESQTYPQRSEMKKCTKSTRSQSLPQESCYVKPTIGTTSLTSKNEECNCNKPSNLENDECTMSRDEKRSPASSDSKDLIMNVIKDITNRYSKKDLKKSERKKCFKEVISILNYLLDTEESTDTDAIKGLRNLVAESCTSDSDIPTNPRLPSCAEKVVTECEKKIDYKCGCEKKSATCCKNVFVDKGIQLCCNIANAMRTTESSDMPMSSELPCTSSDSVTCKVLNRIRKECEKYHLRRCRCQNTKKCECSSTTSVSCNQCKRTHYCMSRTYKCRHKPRNICERLKKKCVAYNLIIQTSESMVNEETTYNNNSGRPLKNIIVKVPSIKKKSIDEIPCRPQKRCNSPRSEGRCHRSRSLPNDSLSSTDDNLKAKVCSVKEYLQKNRPDFIEKSAKRQNCLKMINEARANNRAARRELLSLQVEVEPALRAVSSEDLRVLARQAGLHTRKEPPKLISEREMKKHSEKIYKQLPEVVKKKEDAKKENIKKTNLLMAYLFKKSLQKKALRGSVNLSNYSTVIKI